MSKHTPGPWTVIQLGSRGGFLVMQSAAREIAALDADDDSASVEVARADARLIAAAPELLEALIRCVAEVRLEAKQIEYAARNFGGYDDGPEPPHEYTRLMGVANLAESAIAKARGDA